MADQAGPFKPSQAQSPQYPMPNPNQNRNPQKNQSNPPVDQVKLLQMAEFELGNCASVCVEEEEKQTNRQRKKSREKTKCTKCLFVVNHKTVN